MVRKKVVAGLPPAARRPYGGSVTRARSRDGADGVQTLGAYLRASRDRAGLSQEELAHLAGLSVDAISALERGTRSRPHPSTVP